MKLHEIYKKAVQAGIKYDPRGKKAVDKVIEFTKKQYASLRTDQKMWFSKESLVNPYADTRVLYGDKNYEVKGKILVGIDIGAGELLLADRLIEKGEKIDLVLAHHPEGKAVARIHAVMHMQADIWHKWGVPVNIGDAIIEERMKEVELGIMPVNTNRDVDIAKILKLPHMCIHTPADNMVTTSLQNLFDKEKPERLGELLTLINNIPEYKQALYSHRGGKILSGSPKRRCGKIVVDMTGGTEGSEKIYEVLANCGVGTIVGMHASKKLIDSMKKHHINLVIAGHIASDCVGMNLMIDEIFRNKDIEIIECSGFFRVDRRKQKKLNLEQGEYTF